VQLGKSSRKPLSQFERSPATTTTTTPTKVALPTPSIVMPAPNNSGSRR
jgi:hypothetical protein